MKYWKYSVDDGLHMVLTLDLGSEMKVNLLRADAILELDEFLLTHHPKSLVIASAKPDSFCAGADISEISQLLDSPNEVDTLFTRIDRIAEQLRNGHYPSVAAIGGICLGGGLELAMMCTERIASDNPKTLLGLPETSLGIIPGFGGTQLLPRIVGMRKAAEIILGGAGKKLSAKDALKCGLVASIAKQDELLNDAKHFARDLADMRQHGGKTRRNGIEKIPFLGSAFILNRARSAVLKATKGVYPAPMKALEAMRWSGGELRTGLAREHRAFKECVATNEAKSLISLYFLNESAKSREWVKDQKKGMHAVGPVGVLGSGLMGRGIALSALTANLPVILHDPVPGAVHDAVAFIEQNLMKDTLRGKLTKEQALRRRGLLSISWGADLSRLKRSSIVIEALREDIETKRKHLGDLVAVLENPEAIIATNTSSLPLREIASPVVRKDRFCAMHFFNPAEKMQLVEIAGIPETSPATLATAITLTKMMGKAPIVLDKECPGLVVNRILLRGVAYAMHQTLEGHTVDPWMIDRVLEGYGFMMGPFKTLDLVGFDTAHHVMKFMATCYPDSYPDSVKSLNLAVNKRSLGKKTGRGFYLWNGRLSAIQKLFGKKEMKPNPDIFSDLCLEDRLFNRDASATATVAMGVMRAMQEEARDIMREGVLNSAEMIDLSMILGAGICPNRRGVLGLPLELAKQ